MTHIQKIQENLTLFSINRWTLGRMVILTARKKTSMEIPLLAFLS
jgi:hypothetical protein